MNHPDLYLAWNDALLAHFFKPEREGEQIFLYVNEELIDNLGPTLGSNRDEYIDALKAGPSWVDSGTLCQRALATFKGWRERPHSSNPPYVAYLALFVWASGVEGDFHPAAYYPRLRHLLGYPIEGSTLPSFARMLDLWDDLEHWSTVDEEGGLGVFTARISGNRIHVGLPLAQTILTEHERKTLPRLFAASGLDAGGVVPDLELVRALRLHGQGQLTQRTLSLLTSQRDDERRAILLDVVSDELASWDGEVPESGELESRKYSLARLCIRVDRVARRAFMHLRIRLDDRFPGQLRLRSANEETYYECEESLPGWSSLLRNAATGLPLDAASLDWQKPLQLTDDAAGRHVTFPRREVRLFVEGRTMGLPGLVEIDSLPRNSSFFLLADQSAWGLLGAWLEQECSGVQVVQIDEGLPADWRFARIELALTDAGVRSQFSILSFSDSVRVRFLGGIRSAPGNNFFDFAPPSVVLHGGDGTESLEWDGVTLSREGSDRYKLPREMPLETRISIEVKREDEPIKRVSLFLSPPPPCRGLEPLRRFDQFGAEVDALENTVYGVFVSRDGGEFPSDLFSLAPLLGDIEDKIDRIFLVGQRPGQLTTWPLSVIDEWEPVWLVPLRRRGRAIYCGRDIETDRPISTAFGSRRDIRAWKELLWVNRRKIEPPRGEEVSRLWNDYQQVAKVV